MGARLTALTKTDGGASGIATGCSLRRLVARTLAKRRETGRPLMPLLFAIGIQGVLEEVATHLTDGEQLCAFLDDVCTR